MSFVDRNCSSVFVPARLPLWFKAVRQVSQLYERDRLDEDEIGLVAVGFSHSCIGGCHNDDRLGEPFILLYFR